MSENTQVDVNPVELVPNAFYVVRCDDTERARQVAQDLADSGTINVPCTAIFLQPHESIEILSDERLAEVGLQRMTNV